jgi:hypothetical protein
MSCLRSHCHRCILSLPLRKSKERDHFLREQFHRPMALLLFLFSFVAKSSFPAEDECTWKKFILCFRGEDDYEKVGTITHDPYKDVTLR